jgi:hypothetical protein
VSKSVETKYSGNEFLDTVDEVDGMAVTLEDQVNSYINGLGGYITGDIDAYSLDGDIDDLVYTLDMVYDSLDSLDSMIADENMVARVEIGGKRGVCDLADNLAHISNGAYRNIDSFRDALTLIHYVEEGGIQADVGSFSSRDVDAPTQLVADRDRLKDISQRLDREYNRIVFGEILARRHTETDDNMSPYDPEPPIFRMLGHKDHEDRVNRLNKEFRKNR